MDDIRVGDYVEVAYPRPCCGSEYGMGKRFIVAAVSPAGSTYCCADCFAPITGLHAKKSDEMSVMGWHISRLRKLSPLVAEDKQEIEVSA